MFARFDENPAMNLQDIKETKRYGRTEARTDNVKTVYPLQTKFAGGINTNNITNKSQEVSPFSAGNHKAAMNSGESMRNTRHQKTQMIRKRSTTLKRSVKIFYWRA